MEKAFSAVCTATHFYISACNDISSCGSDVQVNVPSLRIERRTGQVSEGAREIGNQKVEAYYKCEGVIGQLWHHRRRYLLLVRSSDLIVTGVFGTIYEISGVIAVSYDLQSSHGPLPKAVEDVAMLLQYGFYYSSDTDLTNSMRAKKKLKPRNTKYLWNEECLKPFLSAGHAVGEHWLSFIIQGSVHAGHIKGNSERGTPEVASVLIARKCKRRAGTRYSVRGIDDDGAVAGYCEMEQLLSIDGSKPISHVQIRGSVPVFWEQSGPISCSLTRDEEWNTLAFRKHYAELLAQYGQVLFCNLLTDTKRIEKDLSQAFDAVVKKHNGSYLAFDFYAHVGNDVLDGLQGLQEQLELRTRSFGYTGLCRDQEGVVRMNCMDCLDRTNVAQFYIAWLVVLHEISKEFPSLQAFEQPNAQKERGQPSWLGVFSGNVDDGKCRLLRMLREQWANVGDQLSTLSTGTKSILSGQLRNRSEAFNVFDNVRRTVERSYNASFEDSSKQLTYLTLINGGQITRSSENKIGRAPCGALRIWTGTWNLAGKATIHADIIRMWIKNTSNIDVYCFCFQEAIELSPQNVILKTSGDDDVDATIDVHCRSALGEDFVKLRGTGMVGIYTLVFVRTTHMCDVSQVRVQRFRLGTFGGNKGGTSVEFTLKCTDLSFVNVHLEAGESKHPERVTQIKTILNALDSDLVVIGGDFNFRLNLPAADCHQLLESGADLRKHDQYLTSGSLGLEEFPVHFLPTYKFVIGSTLYDTTRGPAWCDRVMWKGQAKATSYQSHPDIMLSDHIPISMCLETPLLAEASFHGFAHVDEVFDATMVDFLSADTSGVSAGHAAVELTNLKREPHIDKDLKK